ncbi:5'-methylthioadenosine/S-adenosylhomocysteine nucleosidase [Ancylobacter defluvii]|uniref:Phosphorylase n=1 Tax=Ancylobacter defluvii TaxID=1282440 RepID=A0A9W6NBY1_9HYPH|nr:5'-methylthioadenosine/S-adenosylhomocysteine nucleosidase [Ancylobacter defluvii]MBS7589460.1 5'-methylthioadenosine/S-adenosylhomocysteine nucleosidase [Ancylobacter defluvii]GLK85077.1 phosphorylase [Ancylobacter defluvii]
MSSAVSPLRLCLAAMVLLIALLPAAAEPVDATPRIAVLCAFEPEWKALRAVATHMEERDYKGVPIVTGEIEGKPVVLVMTGVSMVNAAMTTQMTLDRYNVTRIVVSGIAGGVDPSLNIGDIAVPERWGQYLEVILARETPQGFRLPSDDTPEFANFGMMFPRGVRVFREGRASSPRQFWFDVDPVMLEVARRSEAVTDSELQRCSADKVCLLKAPRVRVGGYGVSGPAFVDNAAFRSFTFDTFKAQVLDMESAAIAHVATTNDVPFIVFRALSDLAGGGPGENEMHVFMDLAANNSVAVMRTFLKALPD